MSRYVETYTQAIQPGVFSGVIAGVIVGVIFGGYWDHLTNKAVSRLRIVCWADLDRVIIWEN